MSRLFESLVFYFIIICINQIPHMKESIERWVVVDDNLGGYAATQFLNQA